MRTTFLLAATTALVACGSDDSTPQPAMLALPGDAYYPESITAAADGTLFVSSLTTGQVTAYADGSMEGRVVIGAGSGITNMTGVHVEDDTLWLCSVDLMFQRENELRSFALDGTPKQTFALGAGRLCNDLAFDDAGNLYVTDSFSGTILRLARGGSALEPWLVDASLAPPAGAFGLDGIVFDGAGSLYVNRFDTGALYRVAIATKTVTPITVTPALASPDGMREIDRDSLLVAEGAGRLTRVDVSETTATATTLATLDMPTSVIEARGSAWVTEGQLGRLFMQQDPVLPFAVRRVDL
jgi:hypothetical protein